MRMDRQPRRPGGMERPYLVVMLLEPLQAEESELLRLSVNVCTR